MSLTEIVEDLRDYGRVKDRVCFRLVNRESDRAKGAPCTGFAGDMAKAYFIPVEEDEEHTAFVTAKGLYCYRVMPFGLKNAGATYQRLINKVFKDQIGVQHGGVSG